MRQRIRYVLTDDFLRQIWNRRLELQAIGVPFGAAIAIEYGASEKTVESWMRKARERGLNHE